MRRSAAEEVLVLIHREGAETVEALGGTVSPANDKTLVWEPSDPAILSVDRAGNLVKSNYGTVVVRATHEESGLYAEVTVSVSELEPSVPSWLGGYMGPYYRKTVEKQGREEARLLFVLHCVTDTLPGYRDCLIIK